MSGLKDNRQTGPEDEAGRHPTEDKSKHQNTTEPATKGVESEPALLKLALGYARRDWHVFPIKAGTKDSPLVKWGTEATTDKRKIREWWDKWPDANIGIATGPSRLCIIDVDVAKEEGNDKFSDPDRSGYKFLSLLEQKYGRLPKTMVVTTPSGGVHYYFIGQTASSVARLGKFIDVRSDGAYVLARGSVVAGREYESGRRVRPMDLPQWVKELAGTKREHEKREDIPNVGFDNPADLKKAKALLRNTEAAPEGAGSDDQAFRVACKLRDMGISEPTAVELMAVEWDHPHDPGWIETKIQNAYAYATGDAGADSAVGDFLDEPQTTNAPKTLKRRKLKPFTYPELLVLPPAKWLVKRLIPDNGLALLYGAPKTGKTFWALDLSLCVATGRDFHGIKVQKGRVTYVAAEGGPGRLRDRVTAWLKQTGADPAELDGQWELVPASVDLTNPQDVTELLKEFNDKRNLVVLDTLARCMSGDENSQQDMGAAIAGCDAVREKTGAAVLLVHHEGKDRSRGARGSTARPIKFLARMLCDGSLPRA